MNVLCRLLLKKNKEPFQGNERRGKVPKSEPRNLKEERIQDLQEGKIKLKGQKQNISSEGEATITGCSQNQEGDYHRPEMEKGERSEEETWMWGERYLAPLLVKNVDSMEVSMESANATEKLMCHMIQLSHS